MKNYTIGELIDIHDKKGLCAIIRSGKVVGFEKEAEHEDRQKDIPGGCRSDGKKRVGKLRTEYERLADVTFGELYRKARKGIMGCKKW